MHILECMAQLALVDQAELVEFAEDGRDLGVNLLALKVDHLVRFLDAL